MLIRNDEEDDVAEFTYDALGRRIEMKDYITSANTRRYYYNDNWQVLAEYDTSNVAKRWYVYGNYIDEVLITSTSTATNYMRFYSHDHLYSPVVTLSNWYVPLDRFEYDAYGNCHVLDANFANDADGLSDIGNVYYFTGRRLDILDGGDLKLQYNRNRYYDCYMGRWLTQDPSEFIDGMNLYGYIMDNPVVFTDPLGLSCCRPGQNLHIKNCWWRNVRFEAGGGRGRKIRKIIIFLTTTTNPIQGLVNGIASTTAIQDATYIKVRVLWDEYYVINHYKCVNCEWTPDKGESYTMNMKGKWQKSALHPIVPGSIKDWLKDAVKDATIDAMRDFKPSRRSSPGAHDGCNKDIWITTSD